MLSNQAGGEKRDSLHGHWSSRMAFILAVTGSAVGLGNIWKFPYIAGQNGGGAFVLVYLVCVIVIGMPVMMSEILIGRRGRRNPVATMELLGKEEGSSGRWRWVGFMGVLAGILILSYYSVIAGWTLNYVVKSAAGVFTGATAEAVSAQFAGFVGNWKLVALCHTLFMSVTIFVVARGVERGLEQAVKFMVPALLVLMLLLLGYSINSGFFGAGVEFLFTPDFEKLTWNSVLVALGQAFFTLSLGMGAIMAYGAYLPEETSITGASAVVVTADTGIAILAGLAIFPGSGPCFRDIAFGVRPYVGRRIFLNDILYIAVVRGVDIGDRLDGAGGSLDGGALQQNPRTSGSDYRPVDLGFGAGLGVVIQPTFEFPFSGQCRYRW